MKKINIPIAAVERNKAWIQAVTETLKQDEKLAKKILHNCGKKCASQLLDATIVHFGKVPSSIDELVKAINIRRRDVLKADTFWEKQDEQYRLILNKCSCDLVETGLATPNPVFCECSRGMFTEIFSKFWDGSIEVIIEKSIGRNDSICKFLVCLNREQNNSDNNRMNTDEGT